MNLTGHWKYLKYVARHKWFVFQASRRFKMGLWQAIIHDWHKFLPSEWTPYVNQFYGAKKYDSREGYYHNPNDAKREFNSAWMKHMNRGPHHWQHWAMVLGTQPDPMVLPMPEKYAREMLADWSGAGMAQGVGDDPLPWYRKNRDKLVLHPDTRAFVERELGYE